MQERSNGEKIFLLGVSVLFAVILTFGMPDNAFLISFYIVPIILAANYYGLAGGLGCAAFSALLAIALVRSSGRMLEDTQVIAQIILYFVVGGFGGFMQRENARILKMLHISTITDELTGLYNYQHFRRRLDEEVARAKRYGHPLAIMMCDVDHFKSYNDTFGHPSGNVVLRKMGTLIKGSVRKSDIPFRYGGDEFAVIFTETGADARVAVERIVKRVNASFESENIEDALMPRITAGVTFADRRSVPSAELISMADRALYKAKKTGVRIAVMTPREDEVSHLKVHA